MFAFLKKLFTKQSTELAALPEDVAFHQSKQDLPRVGVAGVIYKTPELDYVWNGVEYVPFQPYGKTPVIYKGELVDNTGVYPGSGSPRSQLFYCIKSLREDVATITNSSLLSFEEFTRYGDQQKYGDVFNAYVHRQHQKLVWLLRNTYVRNKAGLLSSIENMGFHIWEQDNRLKLIIDGRRITV